jgi:hypothetical protein
LITEVLLRAIDAHSNSQLRFNVKIYVRREGKNNNSHLPKKPTKTLSSSFRTSLTRVLGTDEQKWNSFHKLDEQMAEIMKYL